MQTELMFEVISLVLHASDKLFEILSRQKNTEEKIVSITYFGHWKSSETLCEKEK